MLYRTIPKNGDALSILGFGLMRLPMTQDRQIDEERATRQIRSAVDAGVNYIDTAASYGRGISQRYIGRVMATRRDEVFLATKVWADSVETAEKSLATSLKVLTDVLNFARKHRLHLPLKATKPL